MTEPARETGQTSIDEILMFGIETTHYVSFYHFTAFQ
jgi:hypothetical protein